MEPEKTSQKLHRPIPSAMSASRQTQVLGAASAVLSPTTSHASKPPSRACIAPGTCFTIISHTRANPVGRAVPNAKPISGHRIASAGTVSTIACAAPGLSSSSLRLYD
eukprot:IDg545t1